MIETKYYEVNKKYPKNANIQGFNYILPSYMIVKKYTYWKN